jgi:hypothetical protein
VAALARRVAPADAIDVTATFGLPALPDSDVVLLERAQGAAGRRGGGRCGCWRRRCGERRAVRV